MIPGIYSELAGSTIDGNRLSREDRTNWSGRTGPGTVYTESTISNYSWPVSYVESEYNPRRGSPYKMIFYCTEHWRRG